MTHEQRQTLGLILLLAFLAAIGPLSTDTYLPGLPQMALDLGVSNSLAQWTISSFFLGIAIGQLFMGPFSDRFGRRLVLIGGFGAFFVATAVCAMAPNMETLIAARGVQGLAAAASPAAGRAIVRDLWRGEEAARAMSYITMAIVIAPAIAPTVGTAMIAAANWRAVFWFLLVFSAICLVVTLRRLPETNGPERRGDVRLGDYFRAYAFVVRNPRAWAFLLTGGLSYAALFAYITAASVVYQEGYGVPEAAFALYFALNILALFLGTAINSVMVIRKGYHAMISAGVVVSLIGSLSLLGVTYLHVGGLWALIASLFITILPISALGANCTTGLMDMYPRNAGAAVALFGVMQFGLGAVASAAVGLVFTGSTLSMSVPMIVASIGSFASMIWLWRVQKRVVLYNPQRKSIG